VASKRSLRSSERLVLWDIAPLKICRPTQEILKASFFL
jgi:hypothetical protein